MTVYPMLGSDECYGCAYDTAVRCTVSGPCRQVAAPSDMKYFQERLLPPS